MLFDSPEAKQSSIIGIRKIDEQHLLLSREFQIEMIWFKVDKNITMEHLWVLSAPNFEADFYCQRQLLIVTDVHLIQLYHFSPCNYRIKPTLIQKITHYDRLHAVRLLNDHTLIACLGNRFQTYRNNGEKERDKFEKDEVIAYGTEMNLAVHSVHLCYSGRLTVFFTEIVERQEEPPRKPLLQQFKSLFVWASYLHSQNKASEAKGEELGASKESNLRRVFYLVLGENKVREINNLLFNEQPFQIHPYCEEIFLAEFPTHIDCFKESYLLDRIKSSAADRSNFLRRISQSKIVHFHPQYADIYQFQLDTRTKPLSVSVECVDFLPLNVPHAARYLQTVQADSHYVLFYGLKSSLYVIVSEDLTREQKIDNILEKPLRERFELASKIGIHQKEFYLDMWRRSSKSTPKDFSFLLGCENYKVIEAEIQSKLTKRSISVKDMYQIHRGCLNFLTRKINSENCTVQDVEEYARCHFFLKKMHVYRELKGKQGSTTLFTIQDLRRVRDMDPKQELFTYISEICMHGMEQRKEYAPLTLSSSPLLSPPAVHELSFLSDKVICGEEKNMSMVQKIASKIEILLNSFGQIYRQDYPAIIKQIVNIANNSLLALLKKVPTLLPYTSQEEDSSLWDRPQLEFLTFQTLENRRNQAAVHAFRDSVLFRRNNHITYAVLPCPAAATENIFDESLHGIFYAVYESVYQLKLPLDVINYIQSTYPLLPKHLEGKFEVYANLQELLRANVFTLSLHQVYRLLMEKEKSATELYMWTSVQRAYPNSGVFFDDLVCFLKSEESTWEDLHCLFWKCQWKCKDEKYTTFLRDITEHLLRVSMKKEKIPRIKNILSAVRKLQHFNEASQQMLRCIEGIQLEREMLQRVNVHLTLEQIMQQGQQVIYDVIEEQIHNDNLQAFTDAERLSLYAYKILSELSYRVSVIYGDLHHPFIYKCFFLILLSDQDLVPIGKDVLADQYLRAFFSVSESLIQNMVLYLIKQRYYCDADCHEHREYVTNLSALLPPTHPTRIYIQLLKQVASLFKFSPQQPCRLKFPFFQGTYPRIVELEQILNMQSKTELQQINIEKLLELSEKLKRLTISSCEISTNRIDNYASNIDSSGFVGSKWLKIDDKALNAMAQVNRRQAYSVYFVRLLDHRLMDRALQSCTVLLNIPSEYHIVYVAMIIDTLFQELLIRIQKLIAKLISYYYNEPSLLLSKLFYLLSRQRKFTAIEAEDYLEEVWYQNASKVPFSVNNDLIKEKYRAQAYEGKGQLLQNTLSRLIAVRRQFKAPAYSLLFRLMCHRPFAVAKYLYLRRFKLNAKTLRCFLSYASLMEMFEYHKLLIFGRKLFTVLYEKCRSEILIEDIIDSKLRSDESERVPSSLKYNLTQEEGVFKDCQSIMQKKVEHIKIERGNEGGELEYIFRDRDHHYLHTHSVTVIEMKQRVDNQFTFDPVSQRSELAVREKEIKKTRTGFTYENQDSVPSATLHKSRTSGNKQSVRSQKINLELIRSEVEHNSSDDA